jgi:hypothetical protein
MIIPQRTDSTEKYGDLPGGDRTIFIGRVEAVGFGVEGKQPLVYFANRYARVRD